MGRASFISTKPSRIDRGFAVCSQDPCVAVHGCAVKRLTHVDAIEAEIPRVSALVQAWPATFASADVAAKYVAGVAALRRFEYTRFEGVSKEKFRAYVMWNTARRAWEGEGFEMERVPKEWKRRAEKTKKPEEINDEAKTLTGTSTPPYYAGPC
jgi:hypothetical protein